LYSPYFPSLPFPFPLIPLSLYLFPFLAIIIGVGRLMSIRKAIKLATHYMKKNPGPQKGVIICTASNAGLYPFPIAPLYAIAKHAVVGAVRSLAKPLEGLGIRINGICPNCIGISPISHTFISSTLSRSPSSPTYIFFSVLG
jgi:NAD(P)-dependent dehydrogenase (short-subunit alcohol dehydrogenase family)